ncbi:carboxymuconolactone decarboxylase family protein [Granulosicoccaceae sp. 1_MG-2023]|nr:carboxymuconolactone decarboxylase family protein [Granulosicoccaceae sp. 1_MG-2023]
MTVQLIDPASASAAVKAKLDASQAAFGFVPGLHKALANSPQTFDAYAYLHEQFQNTSFDAAELTVVWQTINLYHECHYCLPAHTGIAHSMKVDPALIDALNEGKALDDPKLRALQATTRAMADQRGRLSEEQEAAFRAAGYGDQQLLEIILGLAQKVISNYVNHLADTPVDAPFKKFVKNA